MAYDRWLNPVPRWDQNTWYAGHFYSGRDPSSAFYSPLSNGRPHAGWDLAAPLGSPIVSPLAGVVAQVGYANAGAGYTVHVRHTLVDGSTVYSRHLHCLEHFPVQVGDYVDRGERIASVGSTGASAGPHDHFEIIKDRMGPVDAVAQVALLIDPELQVTGHSPGYCPGRPTEMFLPPAEWAEKIWDEALEVGYMTEFSDPWANVTKQEMATFAKRSGLLDAMKKPSDPGGN